MSDWVLVALNAELGIHKPLQYSDFTTVRRFIAYNARQYMYSVIQLTHQDAIQRLTKKGRTK